jgi:hypothetical protein
MYLWDMCLLSVPEKSISNRGAVGGSRNVRVALVSSELNPFKTASPSC